MKPLKDFDNSNKAKLLYELFPDEMPKLIDHLIAVCEDFRERKDNYAKNWNNGFMPFDYWYNLSQETAQILKKHNFNMKKSARVFSDQLFYTYTSIFVNDRIIRYADQVSTDEKFKRAVILLYT